MNFTGPRDPDPNDAEERLIRRDAEAADRLLQQWEAEATAKLLRHLRAAADDRERVRRPSPSLPAPDLLDERAYRIGAASLREERRAFRLERERWAERKQDTIQLFVIVGCVLLGCAALLVYAWPYAVGRAGLP